MKVGLLQLGQVAPEVLASIQDGLAKTYPDTDVSIIPEVVPVPGKSFDKKRSQYNSSLILDNVRVFAKGQQAFHRVLAVVDIDIFASGLNYVFGEAYTPGKAALISLWRLKPQFYGDKPNLPLYHSRVLKEAVHELGYTLGVQHCPRPTCVMHFSNSIFDTDRKQSLLCDQSYLQAALTITSLG